MKTEEQKVYRGEERRGDGDIPGREPEGREKITVFSQVGPHGGAGGGERESGGSGTGESERRKTMLCSAKGPPKYSPAG